MCGFGYKKKERKVLNPSLYSLTHRNARTIKLVSLRVRHIRLGFFWPYYPILNHSSLICKFYGLNLKDIYY